MASTPETAGSEGERSAARRVARTHVRDKQTRLSVVYGELVAKWGITVGGLLVIIAVVGIMVFLVRVAVPLFAPGEMQRTLTHSLTPQEVAWINADEWQSTAIRVSADGRVGTFHIGTGRIIATSELDFGGETATAVSGTLRRDQVIFGFADGSVRFGTVGFEVTTTAQRNAPSAMERLDERDRYFDGRIYTQVQTGDYRTIRPFVEVAEPVEISDSAIVAIDYRAGGSVERPRFSFITVDAAGVSRISVTQVQRNLMTGQETLRTSTAELPQLPEGATVTSVLLGAAGDRAIIATDDGMLYRYDVRDANNPVLAEQRRVFADDVAVTALNFLNGEQALVVGSDRGDVDVFFRLLRPAAATEDGRELVRARVHRPQGAAILEITPSQRDKSLVTRDADGGVWVRQSTADRVLFEFERSGQTRVDAQTMMFPRADGVLLIGDDGTVDVWSFEPRHSAATFRTLFGRVWYEGYDAPTWAWQSTAASDDFEPKYSLVPLIFGTLKATVYAMLFAVPIALMGAIYTSEFVHRNVRSTIKPVMEMMESLPTVVLGFLAALVLAPFVEEWIAAVLLAFFALPAGLMLGAFLWQMLPPPVALRFDGIPKFLLMFAAIGLAATFAYRVGPIFEDVLFGGDFKAWVNGDFGTGTPFMFLILIPLSYLLVSFFFHRNLGHRYRDRVRSLDRASAGRLDFVRWIAFFGAALVVAWAAASVLTLLGFDPRGGVIDTYAQRNALVVGFVMGFAIIPNIYTLAEDALNSVPSHLRAGSLACGATPWQTAIWVILPTAASGVFSAVMFGMGRAVGETMIVVMATGNTPILDWNIFAGLRTLSANIAVELPEAVKDGTNYRVLFLCALTLFIMTFVINTFAELIRQRFRKRAFQL